MIKKKLLNIFKNKFKKTLFYDDILKNDHSYEDLLKDSLVITNKLSSLNLKKKKNV